MKNRIFAKYQFVFWATGILSCGAFCYVDGQVAGAQEHNFAKTTPLNTIGSTSKHGRTVERSVDISSLSKEDLEELLHR